MKRLVAPAVAAVAVAAVLAAGAGGQQAPAPEDDSLRFAGEPVKGTAPKVSTAAIEAVGPLQRLLWTHRGEANVFFLHCGGTGKMCRVHLDGVRIDCRALVKVTLRKDGRYTAHAKRLHCRSQVQGGRHDRPQTNRPVAPPPPTAPPPRPAPGDEPYHVPERGRR
jgi:hypothetical protein